MYFIDDPAIWLRRIFNDSGLSHNMSSTLSTISLVLIVIIISWLSNLTAKTIILQIVTRIVKRTTSKWDDILLEQRVFTRLSHFAPALVIWFMAGWALKAYPEWLNGIRKLTYIYMVLAGMMVSNSFIEGWHKIYLTLPVSQNRHIKGYVQLVKLVVILIALLVVISVVFKKEVGTLIAGLGAMAAVLSLIFKDAILGLVASIQLSANEMLKVGDWITLPSRGVDGVTEDISLTTVKVRNFDKTIITIPAYALVNESFQNWKGMVDSGVRQIKKSIFIDIRSIKFPDQMLIEKLSKIPFLEKHFNLYEKESIKPAVGKNYIEGPFFSYPLLTNLGLFRIYAESYLKKHPMIDNNQTIIIKHMEPEVNGLQLQVYAFCNNNSLIPFENLKSEITEHLLAILNEFELKVFQQPTGDDIKTLSGIK